MDPFYTYVQVWEISAAPTPRRRHTGAGVPAPVRGRQCAMNRGDGCAWEPHRGSRDFNSVQTFTYGSRRR